METVIKRPVVGQMIKSEELGIEGEVIEVTGYNESFEGVHAERLTAENNLLQKQLGDNFRTLFFECTVKIIHATEESEYLKENLAILTWEEYQACVNL